ncbi:hypothetical protein M8J77_020016 [Diaphorina citri]|nr:hypothetical protein M8J77_020016 [Diaphorina citri]
MKLVEGIYISMDSGEKVGVAFMDLSKAFDTVDHKKLTEILEKVGIRGKALDLFRGYLGDRTQQVKLNIQTEDKESNKLIINKTQLSDVITCGPYSVPQGTVLSPILYNVYVSGLMKLPIQGQIVDTPYNSEEIGASAKQIRSKPSLNEHLYRGLLFVLAALLFPILLPRESHITKIIINDAHVWSLLFTCLTTRAVHLEVVESETSSDLFLAFRRFIARRGGCSTLLSDNAQQFKLLKKAVETIYSLNEFQDLLNDNKIEFKFTSPLSPWAGGTFERLISIIKQCPRKSIGRLLVSRKQLETLMVEIEYVVNSRPLGYYANEDLIITPNHFLCLKKDSLLPAGLSSNVTLPGSVTFKNLIALWKKGNKYLNIFWSAWYSQYLMSLRERNNVHFRQGKVLSVEPKVGDIVLIKQPKQTRSTWPHGVITKVHLGRDNRIRNVDVRISNGQIITRPVSLLYPFEFHY